MIYLFFSLAVLAFPLLLLRFFDDKKSGFIYILFFEILFQTSLAVFTQFFGIFYFWVIFLFNLIVVVAVAFYIWKKREKRTEFKMDWVLLFVISVSFLCLYQVHYNYTGKISLATDQTISYHNIKNMVYPYPYFSDEWDAVSMINYSINSHKLPFVNPLNNNFYFNFAAPFYSFLSTILLMTKAEALLSYNFISIFINILIIVAGYLFLRINKISDVVAGISALSLLYIASAANLPGFWHLIPIHLGILFSLLGFCFMSLNKTKLSVASAILVLLFYPPMILFYGLALAVFLFDRINFKEKKSQKTIFYLCAGIILSILSVYFLYFLSIILPDYGMVKALIFRLFYPSLSGNFIPQYTFYYVIPIFSLLFFAFGIYYVFRNLNWFFSQIILGVCFWILYSFIPYRIIIDYERIVFFTSIIVVLVSAFGLKIIFDSIDKKWKEYRSPVSKYIGFAFLAGFILFAPFYTSQAQWEKLILINPANKAEVYPKAPANKYITQEDIQIFKSIKQKRFLSIPWKGLVIGVATDNYPAVAKEGMISVGSMQTVSQFLQDDCKGKTDLAKKQKLDYIYLYEFDCNGFEKIKQSEEGFVLYKVI